MLDEDSKRRLETNPLRILDSKNKDLLELIKNAPSLEEFLSLEERNNFELLCKELTSLNINYVINTRLVRGLDYYENMVFEWTTGLLGSQATICAGGRYDILVEQLGGKPNYAVGFALGIERLVLLIEATNTILESKSPDLYLMAENQACLLQLMILAENLRTYNKNWEVVVDLSGGNFKNQFKRADKKAARVACILGNNELTNDTIAIKDLKNRTEQVIVDQKLCCTYIESLLK